MQLVRQRPSTHEVPLPHVVPQAPQFDESRWRSTHALLQKSMQAVAQVPAVQVARSLAAPGGQAVHAAPQAEAMPSPTQLPAGPPQRVAPAAQVVLHDVPLQVGTEPGTPWAQRVQAAPHAVTSVALAHSPLQGLKPAAHVKAQAPFAQTGVPPSGALQLEHEVPHAVMEVLGAQAPLQRLKPTSQVTSHWPWVQAAAPFATPGHATQLVVPQLAGLASETQTAPHR